MSKTAITIAFEQWKAQQGAENVDVVLDEFVFANVPGLDSEKPVDRLETIPVANVVHRQAVSKTGVVNENAVVYSVVLGAEVGDFDFNWIGLVNKASGILAMVVHAPVQKKVATTAGQQGNVLTRSFLMEFSGAATETQINTPADTWQIDFTARLAAMDERQRIENVDIYGAGSFFGDGWLVVRNGNQYSAQPGAGYVGGLRAELAATQPITVGVKPAKIWLDVCWKGTLTSVWDVERKLVAADALQDYQSEGVQHYVFALASIGASGVVTDLRPKGTLGDQQGNSDFVRKDKNLADLDDAAAARKNLGLGSAAEKDSGAFLATASNLGDVEDVTKARKNLGLGDIATHDAKEFVPVTRTVNKKKLDADIALSASDVGALPITGGNLSGDLKVGTAEKYATVDANFYKADGTHLPGTIQRYLPPCSDANNSPFGFSSVGGNVANFPASPIYGTLLTMCTAGTRGFANIQPPTMDIWYQQIFFGTDTIQYVRTQTNTGGWSAWSRIASTDYVENRLGNIQAWAQQSFVSSIQLGAVISAWWPAAGGDAPSGYVLTGGDFNDDQSYVRYKPIQFWVNGGWVNAQG